MKKIVVIVMCVVMVLSLAACAGINKYAGNYIGEWYYSEYPDDESIEFKDDGTVFVGGEKMGTFKAEEESVTISLTEDGEEVICYFWEDEEYSYLEIDGMIYIKGYEEAYEYYEMYCYVDPSDIWSYDFSGEYYKESGNSELDGLSDYDQMVKIKTEGGYTVDQQHGGFTLTDNYSGYWYGASDSAVSVDIDRDNYIMRLVLPSGYILEEYDIEWCEETQEFYFIETTLENYYFRLENVQ